MTPHDELTYLIRQFTACNAPTLERMLSLVEILRRTDAQQRELISKLNATKTKSE